MTKRQSVTIATRELAVLAFAAQRVNGTLHRDSRVFDKASDSFIEVTANKTLMYNSFVPDAEGVKLSVTDEDRLQADAAIAALKNDIVLRKISDRRVSDFMFSLYTALEQESCTARDCGLMAFLPQTYQRMTEAEQQAEKTMAASLTSQFLGSEGQKIFANFTLINKRYLQAFNCWSAFGQDEQGNLIQFLTSKEHVAVSGRISGKIKRLEVSRFHSGAKVTNLNYVKAEHA
jgi:hypothetical protein